jgi:uncharacterized protein (TIGR04255 family)
VTEVANEALPTSLETEPMEEASLEIHFKGDADSIVSVLPGLIYSKFPEFSKSTRTPVADVSLPTELVDDNDLLGLPHVILSAEGLFIVISKRTLSVRNSAPYLGWTAFAKKAIDVFLVLAKSGFISSINKLVFESLDALTFGEEVPKISWLNLKLSIGNPKIPLGYFETKAIVRDDAIETTVEVKGPVTNKTTQARALLITIRSEYEKELDISAPDFVNPLTALKNKNKSYFFSLLTKETLERLGPEYK